MGNPALLFAIDPRRYGRRSSRAISPDLGVCLAERLGGVAPGSHRRSSGTAGTTKINHPGVGHTSPVES